MSEHEKPVEKMHPAIEQLAERIYIAVESVRQNVSYATAEKRYNEDARMIPSKLDRSWLVVAEKLHAATTAAVSERLLSMFGKSE